MKIIKIPFSAGGLGKTNGCEFAPDKIIEKLNELFLNEDGRETDFTIEEVKVNQTNIEETNKNIYNYILQNDDFPAIVGGDHSITYAAFKAFAKKFENPGIIVFDAHPDCENNFSPPSHEDYLRVLIEENIVKKENVIIIGIRNWHKNEYNFLKNNKIKHFTMKEIYTENLNEVCDDVMSLAKNWGALYLSIDIDVLDPAFAPATGHIEPGGLTTRELLHFIYRIKKLVNLKALDIVEINPTKDFNDITAKAGAKIIKELENRRF